MESVWYIYTEAGQEGPHTCQELQARFAAGRITAETYVWRDGFADWQPFASVSELQAAPPAAPVVAAPASAAFDAASESASSSKAAAAAVAAAAPVKVRRGPSKGFLAVAAFLLVFDGGVFAVAQFYPDLIFTLSGREHAPLPQVVPRPSAPTVSPEEKEIRALFAQYDAALVAGDLEALKGFSTSEKAAELEQPEAAAMIGMVQAMRPAGITVETVEISGEEATLTLKASGGEEAPSGTARLVRENGAWKFASESWRLVMGGEDGASMSVSIGDADSATPSSGSTGMGSFAPNVYDQGRAVLHKSGDMPNSLGPPDESMVLVTGFHSETRIDDPKKARLEFRIPNAEPLSNPRRFELALDMTRRGPQTISDDDDLRIIADGGQIFGPKESCVVTVTKPWTGAADGVFACEIKDGLFASAGYEFTISATFTIEGVPPAR